MNLKAPPFRFWIGVMIFFTTFQNYMLRSNMSVSIIAMVDKRGKNLTPACLKETNETVSKKYENTTETKYHWSEDEQATILGAYFMGYIASSLPGGILSEYIGAFHVIMWSSVASAVFTGLTPLSAQLGPYGVVANRIIIGLLGGVVYPAISRLIANWAPPKEKGRFMAAMMGNTLGTVITWVLVGQVTYSWGWPWGFYVLVILMAVYCTAFFILVSDTPDRSRWTSQAERDHIMQAQEGHLSTKKKHVAPYLKILLSLPMWATICAQFGNLWGLNLILTYAPKYLFEVLGFDIKASSGLASLPYIARLFMSFGFGTVGDKMRKKEVMSLTKLRKFFIIFSHFLPAACFFLIRAAGCQNIGVNVLLTLSMGFNGAVVVSHLINCQDLSPNNAGTLYGLMNFIGMTSGFIVPQVNGAINTNMGIGLAASAIIYMIGGIIFSVGGLVFILLGSGEVQSWNDIKEPAETEATTPPPPPPPPPPQRQ